MLHPIEALDQVIDGYESYLRTEFQARDPELRGALEEALARSGFLAQEPYFSAHRPFVAGKAWADLPLDERLARALQSRAGGKPSFQHQEYAIEHLLGPGASPLVVSTGTGSGKSECFIAPVLQAALDDSLQHHKKAGLVALILYPMNALANDQLERIESYLKASGWEGTIDVQMYNRSTTQAERAAMREKPPHVLLTNYQMLEYLLVRPADREALFKDHRLRFLVLDEVHSYRGTLGTHVALLLRRLKAHLKKAAPGVPEPISIGTSATIKSSDSAGGIAERDQAVQNFFARLVGIANPATICVVGELREDVVIPPSATLCLTPPVSSTQLDSSNPAGLLAAMRDLAGRHEGTISLEEAAGQARILWLLNAWLAAAPRSSSQLAALARQEIPEWGTWTDTQVHRVIAQALRVGSALPEHCEARLRLRTHRFVRGGWIFQRCIDPSCGRLYPRGENLCQCGMPTAPLLLCRSCGADFLEMRGTSDGEGKLVPAYSTIPGQLLPDTVDGEETAQTWLLFRPDRWVWKSDEDEEGEALEDEEGDLLLAKNSLPSRAKAPADAKKGAKGAPRTGRYDVTQQTFLMRGDGPDHLIDSKKICPGCSGRRGIFDVITPVSLGTSAAVKVLTEELMEALPVNSEDPKKRLLVFADSRQDAAHQARFISFTARFDRMRMRVVSLLTEQAREEGRPLTFQTLVQRLGEKALAARDNPRLPASGMPRGDDREKVWAYEEAPLLEDIALNRRFRASLEALGLIEVSYEGVGEVVEDILPHAGLLGLASDRTQLTFAINRLLDQFRQSGALHRDMLRYHTGYLNYPDKLRGADWARRIGTVSGLPASAAREVGLRQVGEVPKGVTVRPIWHAEKGARPAPEKLFLHLSARFSQAHTQEALVSEEGFSLLMESLAAQGLIKLDKLYGYSNQPLELYQVNDAGLQLAMATDARRARCNRCSLVVCGEEVRGMPCPRCSGILVSFSQQDVFSNRYARRASLPDAIALVAKEHTAQVTTDARKEIEESFKSADQPTNVLACSPTLEMGIDVGGLDAVLLRNVPPRPDNYAQRGGRAGRRSRVGMVLGYTRNTPHDQYFYEHAEEMIAGEVPAPAFSLGNRDIVARHVLAIAVGLAEPGLAPRMNDYVSFAGQVRQERVDELKTGLLAVQDQAVALALAAFAQDVLDEAAYTEGDLDQLLAALPERLQDAFTRTAVQVQRLRSAIETSFETGLGMRDANRSTALINKLLGNSDPRERRSEDDSSGAYPLRRLAEFGILPGYEFPPEPASVRLLSDRDEEQPITAGRPTGLRQYQPGAPVYARGKKWEVFGIDLSSPWNPQGQHADSFGYLRCSNCNLIRSESTPSCPRCHLAQAAKEKMAMAYAGFVARPDDRMAASEEDRTSARDTVELHPSWQAERVAGRWEVEGSTGWRWEWRQGETVYWLNEGKKNRDGMRDLFSLCPECGKMVDSPLEKLPAAAASKGRAVKAPAKTTNRESLGHSAACARFGEKVERIALYAEGKVETLRLIIPWPIKVASQKEKRELESWGWSLGYALLAGAEKYFALASGDIEVLFEGIRIRYNAGVNSTAGRESKEEQRDAVLTFIDPNIGGSGYLKKLAVEMPQVAAAALKHLDHRECELACYRCLKSYSNQRYHDLLNWQCVTGALEGLAASMSQELPLRAGDTNDMAAWQEAFAAGCGSPLELKALRAIEGLRLKPARQHTITAPDTERPFTIPDFAFVDERIAIFIDGVAYHVGDRLRRDKAIDEKLGKLGWRVLRFTARDIYGGKLAEELGHLQIKVG